jgi:hypothetical protein
MADQVQCPNCNNYKITSVEFRVDSKTGKRVPDPLGGCFGPIIILIGIPVEVVSLIVFILLAFMVPQSFVMVFIPAGLLALTWWMKTWYEKNPAGHDHTCQSCGKKWTVEPKL